MKKIEVISIPVTDQERSKLFYQQLGMVILAEAPFAEGQRWVQLGFPGQDASVTLVTWFPKMPAGCIQGLVIKTDDLEKDIADLTAKGVTIGDVEQTPWGKFLSVKDPDGNALSLHQE